MDRSALEHDPLRKLAYYATLILTFLKASSLHEIFAASTGFMVPWMPVLMPLALGGTLLSGGVQRTFRHPTARYWVLFALILVVGVPFSVWPGGSGRRLFEYLRVDYLFFLLLAGSVVTWQECRRILVWSAAALAIPTFFALRGGSSLGDRMSLSFFTGGSIADPNYLAAHILLLIPFVLFSIGAKGRGKFAATVLWGICAAALYAMLRTGSRGGLVALAVALFLLIVRSRPAHAIGILAGLCLALPVGLTVLPSETVSRLLSFTLNEKSTLEAIQSKQSREYLFRKSIEFTLSYPVFGVGLGQFATAEGFASREQGNRGNWHETHNAYTQVSSECGIPALLAFLTTIGSIFAAFVRAGRLAHARGNQEMARAAKYMLISMTGFSVAIMFLSVAYSCYIPIMAGIALAMLNTDKGELAPAAGQLPTKRPFQLPPFRMRASR